MNVGNAPLSKPLVERLRALPPEARERIFERVEEEFGAGALSDVRYDFLNFWLRENQIVRDDDIIPEDRDAPSLVLLTGPRGDGKTQGAIALYDRLIREGKAERPRIFAATEGDVDKAVVHGESGIMSLYHRLDPNRPRFMRAEGLAGVLRYPNGVEVLCFSAKAAEGAVGFNGDLDLYDDVAKWGAHAFTAWKHARISCRIGIALGIVATTRRGTHLLRRLLDGDLGSVLIRRSNDLQANRFNLSPKVYRQLREELGDSDLIRQELDDEDISASSPFAGLDFEKPPIRIYSAPQADFEEIAVAVDPAEGKGGDHDEWGIGAGGRRADRHVVLLDDRSGSYSDDEAAEEILRLCETWCARTIVVENNRGQERIERLLKAARGAIETAYWQARAQAQEAGEVFNEEMPWVMREFPKFVFLQAKEQKKIRAGPLRTLYLQGTLHHIAGLRKLEKQQREWDPSGPRRPRVDDRIDWAVHVALYLAGLSSDTTTRREHVEGLAERVRDAQGRRGAPKDNGLIKSDAVPASDPRSSFRPPKTRGSYSLQKKRIW